jgi:hypothetical protein
MKKWKKKGFPKQLKHIHGIKEKYKWYFIFKRIDACH